MHPGALGVQSEIAPSCVLVHLTGSLPTTLGVMLARAQPVPVAAHSASHKRRLTEVSVGRGYGLLPLPAARRLW